MTPRLILTFGLSALVFGGTMVGCTATSDPLAKASDRSTARATKSASRDAAKAMKALNHRDGTAAVPYAESAVALAPQDAGYRMVLGQAYLQAGRFASARDTFADVLQLNGANGKAALNLALAQIATGDWASARATLERNAAIIPIGDLGLATALAGNPAGAVAMLTDAARTPSAGPKVRQNLALSYALAGQWGMARVVAAADMSPADVDARIAQWAAFAQPKGASDQVASLLGVTPVVDAGRPVALALTAPVQVTPIADTPIETAARTDAAVPAAAAAAASVEAPVAAPSPAATQQFAKVVFGPRNPVVQPLPTMLIRADAAPAKLALAQGGARAGGSRVVQDVPAAIPFVRKPAAGGGDWYVQLGAFSNVAIAKSGWDRATRRFASLSGHQPTGTPIAARQGSLYRLSVGGFTREDADRMCRRYRAQGGDCFVRREAGDRMAQWLATPVRLASRG
ncbi:SPOR domain-containing protein [Sphingomonas sp. CLY1604]|uniref:SPOR domain-containing protein n=1 Tax=Sphingomonas sp. CLY1604 TaxID=3457786 RepID=UPI003FD73F38